MISQTLKVTLWSKERTDPLIDQLLDELLKVQAELPDSGSRVVKIGGRKTRIARYQRDQYTIIAASENTDRVNSKKLMDQDINSVFSAAATIYSSIRQAEQRTRRLIHNLKSLTAKTSQEIFYLVGQDRMLSDPKETINYIEGEIEKKPHETAKAIIEILKHQAAQKAEYSAFEKLSGKIESIKKENHDIHRVLMNVFYLFFGEFLDKKVKVSVDRTRLQANFDYDSIHACIYYLVENAAKYTMRNSTFNVFTTEDHNGYIDIRFEMESLAVTQEEQQKVFDEGFSGKSAIANNLHGTGIGLYLAKAMATLNGATLNFTAGKPTINQSFARNSFVLSLKEAVSG